MSSFALFVTASNVNVKALNKAIVLLREYEHLGEDDPPEIILVSDPALAEDDPEPTWPPIAETVVAENGFAGMDVKDINRFVFDNQERLSELGIETNPWLVLDQAGLDNDTCIVNDRSHDDEAADHEHDPGVCRGLRCSYGDGWICLVNLSISNVNFEDFLPEPSAPPPEGVYESEPDIRNKNTESYLEAQGKRTAELARMRTLGYVE